MAKKPNYAFIDSQNLNLAIQNTYTFMIRPYTRDMNDLRKKLEYRGQKKKNPHKDGTLKGKSSIGDNRSITKNRRKVNESRTSK